jgi:hypothetical protein
MSRIHEALNRASRSIELSEHAAASSPGPFDASEIVEYPEETPPALPSPKRRAATVDQHAAPPPAPRVVSPPPRRHVAEPLLRGTRNVSADGLPAWAEPFRRLADALQQMQDRSAWTDPAAAHWALDQ